MLSVGFINIIIFCSCLSIFLDFIIDNEFFFIICVFGVDIILFVGVVVGNKKFVIFVIIRLGLIDEVSGWSLLNNLLCLFINFVFFKFIMLLL